MSKPDRRLPPSPRPFVRAAEVAAVKVGRIEGAAEMGELSIKPLVVGDEMACITVIRKKGLRDPEHAHPDHESICYLVSGRMRVVIAGEAFIAEPGDCWLHKPGVLHYHETLEDSVQLEIKAPPTKTWD